MKISIFQSVLKRQCAEWTTIVKLRPSRSTVFTFYPQKLLYRCSLNFYTMYSGISVAILKRAYTRRCCILFWNARATSDRKTNVSFVTPISLSTNSEKLVQHVLRYLAKYAKCCHIVPRVTFYILCAISGGRLTGQSSPNLHIECSKFIAI